MKNDNKIIIKRNVSKLTTPDINFHKINTMMNQRLVGLLDYLKASVYFSVYNKKNVKNEKNLEKFFKSKIFAKKPFFIKNESKLQLSDKKKQNKKLNIIVNIKNNQINFKKNKFISPFVLHSKKSHFLKNMVMFSKHLHSEERKEEEIKKRYPKLESISLNSSEYHNFAGNKIFLTPRISKYDTGITVERNDKFISTGELKRNFKSLNELNSNNCIPTKFNDNILLSDKKRIKSSKTWLSLDNNKEDNANQLKKRFQLKIRNLYQRNMNESCKGFKNSYYNSISNINYNNEADINKTSKISKSIKPNCYYNNLHLLKLSKALKKHSFGYLE